MINLFTKRNRLPMQMRGWTRMPKWLIGAGISLLLIFPVFASAQDIPVLIKEGEKLESSFREYDALQKYKEVLRHQPANLNVLCRASDLCSRIGHRDQDKAKKADYFKAAKTYAEVALKVNPQSAEANFVMAVAMGRMALISSGKEKVQFVNEIRKYAENTLKYDPNSFKAYHVLGKWNYEVSSLNAVERGLAKLLFGGIPRASLHDAIRYYEKSKALESSFALNYLELAKAYHRNKQDDKAKELLKKLETLPNKIEDDTRIKKEGKELLKELK
jgi:tetratricopeptide (TPR) repeat protein